MNQEYKSIVNDAVSLKQGEFKNDRSMTERLPLNLKTAILTYLKAPAPGLIGDTPLVDPVTGLVYSRSNAFREKDGFLWSTSVIFMFEHYDIRLSEEFLRLFQ